ncbi:hypothetical protein OTU49_008963 [Cherax quadricarinatus]|uniref:Uncharacterized protein n=1 Tax=Cherax quadricarinatus TaxID=27406 RepID=A0AAW0Y4J3_CHEQU
MISSKVCLRQGDLSSPMFVRQVRSLPVMQDALSLGASLYRTTKDKQYVGVAVQAAEMGVWVAANIMLPLVSPLLERVSGWTALDEWACMGLDHVKEALPVINKQTKEIVSTTRNTVLTALAGNEATEVPPSFSAALTSRATHTNPLGINRFLPKSARAYPETVHLSLGDGLRGRSSRDESEHASFSNQPTDLYIDLLRKLPGIYSQ